MEIRNKKDFIIQEYIKQPQLDLKALAEDNYIDYSHVKRTINEFKAFISVVYPIFCVKSLDCSDVYYLFIGDEEKKIKVKNNRIINKVTLTDYEKLWLQTNKNIDAE